MWRCCRTSWVVHDGLRKVDLRLVFRCQLLEGPDIGSIGVVWHPDDMRSMKPQITEKIVVTGIVNQSCVAGLQQNPYRQIQSLAGTGRQYNLRAAYRDADFSEEHA